MLKLQCGCQQTSPLTSQIFLDICALHHIKVKNKESESTIKYVFRRKLDFVTSYILSYYEERRQKKKEERKEKKRNEERKGTSEKEEGREQG